MKLKKIPLKSEERTNQQNKIDQESENMVEKMEKKDLIKNKTR